jgi:hypothetical protein
MIHTTDFFQKEAQECRTLAVRATKKKDREFWLSLAQRWEWLLQPGSAPDEADQGLRFERSIRQSKTFAKRFAKRRAA